jgi:hypothetical protein
MCDYSLHAVATRPAEAGETLVSTKFRGTATRGFASPEDLNVAVCVREGTQVAFEESVRLARNPAVEFLEKVPYFGRLLQKPAEPERKLATFVQVDKGKAHVHHDAFEFIVGDTTSTVLLTDLASGQKLSILQLPVDPAKLAEHKAPPAFHPVPQFLRH